LPKSFVFSEKIKLTRIVVPGLAGNYTLTYSDRFQ
jgi:hypothetical protein